MGDEGIGMKTSAGQILTFLGLVSAAGLGCGSRADDINRVQPGYVRKAIFQTADEWYYRRTIVESELTNQEVIEGSGDIFLDRVRFEVQEDYLLAYKPYEAIPGAQLDSLPGSEFSDFEGTVLAAWPITSHFDIQRDYDALTGRESNVIDENTTDRPWHEREYMRVDFHENVVNDDSFFGSYAFGWFPISYFSSGKRTFTNQETQPIDPFASRFSDDYVEINDHAFIGQDLYLCMAMTGFSSVGGSTCGFGEAKVRHSFARITEESDYQPKTYPDSVVRTDAEGNAISDPETGEVLREPIYNRFGVFRLDAPTYDRGYGSTESGKRFFATLHNLWERHTDGEGNVLPHSARTPRPVVYYLNAEFPPRYRVAAAEVAAEYDRVLRGVVSGAMGVSADQVPTMFEIRDNDCNLGKIQSYVQARPELLFAVERGACNGDNPCTLTSVDEVNEQVIGIGNLKQVCSSLESATRDATTGASDFVWQRVGDVRYSMLVWLANPQQSGWGGYGPMHADARTGEVVSATSFLRGWVYERSAANIVDYVELINDEKSVSDIVYGQDIRTHTARVQERVRAMADMEASETFQSFLKARLDGNGKTAAEALTKNEHPNHQLERLRKLEGTRLEDLLVTEMDLAMASGGTWRPGDEITEELRARALPAGRVQANHPLSSAAARARSMMGQMGFCYLEHEFDPHWAGLALNLQGLSREERYQIVVARLVKHVMLHELGHNFGLAHNFEGTYDALNYGDRFWEFNEATPAQKLVAQHDEYRHTTVMEYMSSKGAFADSLGKYDEAALRFAYANQVQVFSDPAVDPNLEGGDQLREWRYLNDYQKLPDHLCGAAGCGSLETKRNVLKNRDWVSFDPQNPPANEVPYLFCDNTFDRRTPFCATFDYGSNLREIQANYYSMWSNYFFFTNFIRDRLSPLGWRPESAEQAATLAALNANVVNQYMYYLNATDPDFSSTDLFADMAVSVSNGLNMAAEIMSTPEPERMCPWQYSQDPRVPPIYVPHYLFASGCDEYLDLNSAEAAQVGMIQPRLGDARPSGLGFTEDYEDFAIAYIGSYFDKNNVLLYLGLNNPTLIRFNYDLDIRNYEISLYRTFENELREFLFGVMELDTTRITPGTGTTLGSFWCRDPGSPNVAHLGYFEPRRLLDPENGLVMPGPSASCQSATRVYPTFLSNTPISAMSFAHTLYSSDFDSQLDLGKAMKIFVKGADDDFVDWDGFPDCDVAAAGQVCFCSVVDDLTSFEYRALESDVSGAGEGCRLIERARQAQVEYNQDPSNVVARDNWRDWVERLEIARFLYRLFNHR